MALGRGDELDACAAACLFAEDTGHRVGQPGNQSCRDLAAVRARQGRLADAERDRWRRVIDSPPANAPASVRYAGGLPELEGIALRATIWQ